MVSLCEDNNMNFYVGSHILELLNPILIEVDEKITHLLRFSFKMLEAVKESKIRFDETLYN